MVEVVNGREAIEVLEAGTGPNLVYLPGIWGLQWDTFLEALAQDHHVIAIRPPGTGKSSGDERMVDMQDLVFELASVLDALGVDEAALVGHDLGGMIAAELAAMEPARYRRLVLIAPFGLWDERYPNVDLFFYRDNLGELGRRMFKDPEHPAVATILKQPAAAEEGMPIYVERARHYQVAAKYLWPLPDRGLRKRAHRVTAPTLIAWGRADGIVPVEYAQDFGRLFRDATVKVFEGSAHVPQLEEPEAVLAAVRAHLG
jgi:pimeloyl-ACP methyl ester carboxylesterase